MNQRIKEISKFILFMLLCPGVFWLALELIRWISQLLEVDFPFALQFWLCFQVVFIFGWVIHHFHDHRKMTFFDQAHILLKELSRGNYAPQNLHELKEMFQHDEEWNVFFHEMEETFHNLAEMERVKQEFISDVSHEIRSPLTSIIGFSQLAQKSNISPEKKEHYLKMIQQEALRLNRLSTNLLALADLENQKNGIEKTSFSVDSQLLHCLASFEPQIKEKNLTVMTQLESVRYNGNEVLLQQVWQNLIQNAIKFSKQEKKLFIQVKRNEVTESFQVKISDQGIGLSPSEKIRIFERFYKADNSRSQNSGHGLGLAVVAKIIELHQDLSIAVESTLGEGTTFIIEGPQAIIKEESDKRSIH